MIKNNLLELIKLNWGSNSEIILELMDPEQFYKLCDYCLIPYDFQYCNEYNLIYNSPLCIIYMIPEKNKSISSCASKSESTFNSDSNFNNDDNKNNDARFDLRYPEKNAIKLKPHSCICINLKIALEILATIVQLTSKSSLAKKGINIRGGIINAEYVGNIIVILQNDLEKAYIIEPNKKIAQAIFLFLVKIAKLVSIENRKELEITAKEIQKFRSMGKIDVPVNLAEEKIIIETEATLYELGEIGLVNLHILAKNHSHIKISIYNNIKNIIEIPEGIIIGYLTTEIEDQLPNTIPDFP
ncbi:hypothetical protein G9A89_017343 [Geosiphon pyriformis]|nr:hypothetical protein G9A89_017343 [Geosiphon pyriformis]